MSKTISFVASDQLAEFLEDEAERRMTTISSTAQMLLAEKVREMEGGGDGGESGWSEYKSGSEGSEGGIFDRHPDKWYRPDGEHEYAVRQKDDRTKYYKTRNGAAKRLRMEYE